MRHERARPSVNLILFTAAYPFATSGEKNFLEMELPYLLRSFERVILVPERCEITRAEVLPAVEIEAGYAEYLLLHGRADTFARGARSSLVREELAGRVGLLLRPTFLKRLLFFAGQAELTRSWLTEWMKQRNMEPGSCLIYTYWFDQGAVGAGMAKKRLPDLRSISRAHGYDVYEDRQSPPYWPCRGAALGNIDFVFPVSEAGTRHLREKYPDFAEKIETRRLGVPDPGKCTGQSSDGVYRIVSCSLIAPVKRLDLMLAGIKAAAQRRPSQRFEWVHIGSGVPGALLAGTKALPQNLRVNLVEYRTRAGLFRFYGDNPVDVFINVSASEGTPVAIMEAISCGIPVIATAVGGNGEIVSAENGLLISANPAPDEIADALLSHWDAPGQRRAGSRKVWSSKYDADKNYSEFVQRLVEIRG
jgi:glycosyltransferase involved in cell wall biosynthesis